MPEPKRRSVEKRCARVWARHPTRSKEADLLSAKCVFSGCPFQAWDKGRPWVNQWEVVGSILFCNDILIFSTWNQNGMAFFRVFWNPVCGTWRTTAETVGHMEAESPDLAAFQGVQKGDPVFNGRPWSNFGHCLPLSPFWTNNKLEAM